MLASFALFFLVLAWGGGGCGSSSSGNGFAVDDHDGGAGESDASSALDVDLRTDGEGGAPAVLAHLTGKVLAPEGTIPISNALLYLVPTPPAPIPGHVYCDKCVKLTADTAYTYSKPDGTFDLGATAIGPQYLVVQKGQFRRVRAISVAAGSRAVDASSTTLPAKSDPTNGDDIPKMAIVQAAWDHIEISLAKLGLATIVHNGIFGDTVTNASFDIKDVSMLNDATTLDGYHIVFIPCSFSSGTTCDTSQPSGDSNVQNRLRAFVTAGGKVYVTDYAYEFVRQPWPGFVDWENQTSTLGSACMPGSYDAPANVDDPGLKSWLTAIGETNVTLQQSWTAISGLLPQQGLDSEGKLVTITPKVWVSAKRASTTTPATVSFENGCGRVLFSTYHTEGNGNAALLAQEKALLYVLLEVGVCVGQPPPPR
jgi:hypothetical protein